MEKKMFRPPNKSDVPWSQTWNQDLSMTNLEPSSKKTTSHISHFKTVPSKGSLKVLFSKTTTSLGTESWASKTTAKNSAVPVSKLNSRTDVNNHEQHSQLSSKTNRSRCIPVKPLSSFKMFVTQRVAALEKKGFSAEEASNKAVEMWNKLSSGAKDKLQKKYEVKMKKFTERVEADKKVKKGLKTSKRNPPAVFTLPPNKYISRLRSDEEGSPASTTTEFSQDSVTASSSASNSTQPSSQCSDLDNHEDYLTPPGEGVKTVDHCREEEQIAAGLSGTRTNNLNMEREDSNIVLAPLGVTSRVVDHFRECEQVEAGTSGIMTNNLNRPLERENKETDLGNRPEAEVYGGIEEASVGNDSSLTSVNLELEDTQQEIPPGSNTDPPSPIQGSVQVVTSLVSDCVAEVDTVTTGSVKSILVSETQIPSSLLAAIEGSSTSVTEGFSSNEYKCQICKRAFAHLSWFKKHIENCKMRYQCDECKIVLKNKKNLKEHIRNFHDAVGFLCQHCEQKFSTEKKREIHIRNKHGETKVCPMCNAKLKNKKCLAKHMKKSCKSKQNAKDNNESDNDINNSSTSNDDQNKIDKNEINNNSTLKSCENIQNVDSSVNPQISKPRIKCDACHKTFETRSGLRRHWKTHTSGKGSDVGSISLLVDDNNCVTIEQDCQVYVLEDLAVEHQILGSST